MTTPFPKSPTFSTIDEPFRFEGELYDLEVEGQIPTELDGTFFSGYDNSVVEPLWSLVFGRSYKTIRFIE